MDRTAKLGAALQRLHKYAPDINWLRLERMLAKQDPPSHATLQDVLCGSQWPAPQIMLLLRHVPAAHRDLASTLLSIVFEERRALQAELALELQQPPGAASLRAAALLQQANGGLAQTQAPQANHLPASQARKQQDHQQAHTGDQQPPPSKRSKDSAKSRGQEFVAMAIADAAAAADSTPSSSRSSSKLDRTESVSATASQNKSKARAAAATAASKSAKKSATHTPSQKKESEDKAATSAADASATKARAADRSSSKVKAEAEKESTSNSRSRRPTAGEASGPSTPAVAAAAASSGNAAAAPAASVGAVTTPIVATPLSISSRTDVTAKEAADGKDDGLVVKTDPAAIASIELGQRLPGPMVRSLAGKQRELWKEMTENYGYIGRFKMRSGTATVDGADKARPGQEVERDMGEIFTEMVPYNDAFDIARRIQHLIDVIAVSQEPERGTAVLLVRCTDSLFWRSAHAVFRDISGMTGQLAERLWAKYQILDDVNKRNGFGGLKNSHRESHGTQKRDRQEGAEAAKDKPAAASSTAAAIEADQPATAEAEQAAEAEADGDEEAEEADSDQDDDDGVQPTKRGDSRSGSKRQSRRGSQAARRSSPRG